MNSILLNVDVGEGVCNDFDLIILSDLVNICCGAYAGSTELALSTAQLCKDHGKRFGAHPGIPDRDSFGRGPLQSYEPAVWISVRASLCEQIDLLVSSGSSYVKPHGELYNASAVRQDAGELLASCLRQYGLPLMGLPGTLHEEVARAAGISLIREGFADRRYNPNGTLVPRGIPGAILNSDIEIKENLKRLMGTVDTICVHGDTEDCLRIAKTLRRILDKEGEP